MEDSAFLAAVTVAGNSLLLLALTLTSSFYLFLRGYRREAAVQAAAFFCAAVLISLLKLGFALCGSRVFGIYSPSGHAALALSVYGVLAFILVRCAGGKRAALLAIGLIALSFMIGYSRIALDLHTPQEVFLGWGAGGGIIILAVWILRRTRTHGPRRRLSLTLLLPLLLLAAALTYEFKFTIEDGVARIATLISTEANLTVSDSVCAGAGSN